MTRRLRIERAVTERGFTRWVTPEHGGFMLACCDCGLVHEMQFRIAGGAHVQFRGRRAAAYTRAERKKKCSYTTGGGNVG